MQNKPWFEESDLIKDFYGYLSEEDIKWIYDVLKNVDLTQARFITNIDNYKNKVQLLDFSDYYNKPYQFDLLLDLIHDFYRADGFLFWLPLNNNYSENVFEKFDPLMVAKTPIDVNFLERISRSMMQIINGGYIVFDSGENFIAIVIDGYYMLALVDYNLSSKYGGYLKNWEIINEKLDAVTAGLLRNKKK